jgi:hypothetical protein
MVGKNRIETIAIHQERHLSEQRRNTYATDHCRCLILSHFDEFKTPEKNSRYNVPYKATSSRRKMFKGGKRSGTLPKM